MTERETLKENEMTEAIPAKMNGRTPYTVKVKATPRAHATHVLVRYAENVAEAYESAVKMVEKEYPKGKLLSVTEYTGATTRPCGVCAGTGLDPIGDYPDAACGSCYEPAAG